MLTVKDTYRYCGQCGQPLEDDIVDDHDGVPPSSRPPARPGFLSNRSIEYMNQLHKGEKEWDPELSGYAHLKFGDAVDAESPDTQES